MTITLVETTNKIKRDQKYDQSQPKVDLNEREKKLMNRLLG